MMGWYSRICDSAWLAMFDGSPMDVTVWENPANTDQVETAKLNLVGQPHAQAERCCEQQVCEDLKPSVDPHGEPARHNSNNDRTDWEEEHESC